MRFAMIRWLSLSTSLALAAAPARAEPPKLKYPITCDEDDPRRCTQPLVLGEPAPFSGQLLNTEKAIQLAQAAAHCAERTQIEVTRAQALDSVKLDLEKQLHTLDREGAEQREQLLQERIAELAKRGDRAWYEHPALLVGIGVVSATLVFFAAVQIRQTAQ